jgi:hypothetical protein
MDKVQLRAYQRRDIEKMVAAKDFALDAKIFWQDLGLPVDEKQMEESVGAFETNFRKQMKESGIPDYRGAEYSFVGREQPQENLVVLTLDLRWSDGRREKLRLPVLKAGSQWKAVRIPPYDHL